jgi:N6-L-threonylcarbamoyladenine synthase
MLVLGIESSCDDTAAAILQMHDDPKQRILGNVVHSQMDHLQHGGVVPEIAARAHIEKIQHVIDTALKDANITYNDLDGIAATCGPGLIGCWQSARL